MPREMAPTAAGKDSVGAADSGLRSDDRPEAREQRHRNRAHRNDDSRNDDRRPLPGRPVDQRTERRAGRHRGDPRDHHDDPDLAGVPVLARQQIDGQKRPDPGLHVGQEKIQPVERRLPWCHVVATLDRRRAVPALFAAWPRRRLNLVQLIARSPDLAHFEHFAERVGEQDALGDQVPARLQQRREPVDFRRRQPQNGTVFQKRAVRASPRGPCNGDPNAALYLGQPRDRRGRTASGAASRARRALSTTVGSVASAAIDTACTRGNAAACSPCIVTRPRA